MNFEVALRFFATWEVEFKVLGWNLTLVLASTLALASPLTFVLLLVTLSWFGDLLEFECGFGIDIDINIGIGIRIGIGINSDIDINIGTGIDIDINIGIGFGISINIGIDIGIKI